MIKPESYSQFGQDRYVAEIVYPGKRGGYFVEAGAGDGLWISNTLLLERRYGWTGILIEPTSAFAALQRNRAGCICENCGLASEERMITMVEIFDRGQAAISPAAKDNLLLSRSTKEANQVDLDTMNSYWGVAKRQYLIRARPLADVLRAHRAPRRIDYLSLDVEGFEFEILRLFPFGEYEFGCLTIERPVPELQSLLAGNGYIFKGRLGEDHVYTRA
ncbi:MAG: FkbM family methyltransferase [Bradyrhizobiaceae bacterium]|nr:FkbM family methyltransferase [Bradyrhizobiaceae bacterium]